VALRVPPALRGRRKAIALAVVELDGGSRTARLVTLIRR
jgi:hypothetical protein